MTWVGEKRRLTHEEVLCMWFVRVYGCGGEFIVSMECG